MKNIRKSQILCKFMQSLYNQLVVRWLNAISQSVDPYCSTSVAGEVDQTVKQDEGMWYSVQQNWCQPWLGVVRQKWGYCWEEKLLYVVFVAVVWVPPKWRGESKTTKRSLHSLSLLPVWHKARVALAAKQPKQQSIMASFAVIAPYKQHSKRRKMKNDFSHDWFLSS